MMQKDELLLTGDVGTFRTRTSFRFEQNTLKGATSQKLGEFLEENGLEVVMGKIDFILMPKS